MCILIGIWLSADGAPLMTNNLDIYLDEAFTAYNQGQYERAESLCRDVLSAQPENGDALFLLGLIAYRAGAFEPAETLLLQAVKLYPNIENYRLTLASVLQKQGRLDEALTHYQKYPEHPMGLTQQGFIYLQKNQTDFAKSAFEKALKLQPNLPEARLGLALYRGDEKEIEKLARQTDLPDSWYYLARCYRQTGHPKKALNAIERIGLKQQSFLIEKAVILEQLKRLDEALNIYQDLLKQDSFLPDVWANQGNILRHKGQTSQAEDCYKRALALDRDHVAARHNLADLLYREKRIPEALEQYRYILSRYPDNTAALYNLAVILEETADYAEAAGLYFRILLKPNAPKGIEWRLSDTLAALSEQNMKLAKDFTKGWLKNFPNDVVANHLWAAFHQKKEKNILSYVQKLYDDFADTYNDKMVELKATALSEIEACLPVDSKRDILDLGCGTGQFGVKYPHRYSSLVGVDISEGMLEKARQTNRYTRLVRQDIEAYLQQSSDQYDLITALEVLGYLPEIQPLFIRVFDHLKPGGFFAFSVELSPENKTILSPNGRYLYIMKDIYRAVRQKSWKIVTERKINLRREKKSYADGVIMILKK